MDFIHCHTSCLVLLILASFPAKLIQKNIERTSYTVIRKGENSSNSASFEVGLLVPYGYYPMQATVIKIWLYWCIAHIHSCIKWCKMTYTL